MKTLNQVYEQCLQEFKTTGKREHPSHLLAMLLLMDRNAFTAFEATEGQFYDYYQTQINKKINQIISDFQISKKIMKKYIKENVYVTDYKEDMIWFVFYDGFATFHHSLLHDADKTPEQIYVTYFESPKITIENAVIHNKLVRDKIPDIISEHGDIPVYHHLAEEEYWLALLDKDKEELEEIRTAKNKREIKQELGDKLEVLKAMASYHGYTLIDIIEEADKKQKRNGSFTKRLYLQYTHPKNKQN